MGQLPCPIGTEVGDDHSIARADETLDHVDDRRGHELVVLAAEVGGFDRRRRARRPLPDAVDDRVIAAFDPIPTAVAIHRVVAPADRRDPCVRVGRREPPFEVGDEAERGSRRRVAAIEQRVDADRWDAEPRRELHQGHEMTVVGMDPTGADQADQVEAAERSRRPPARRHEGRPIEEAAVGDRRVDAREVLEDRTAGPQVQVTHLRVAHLARRQADRLRRGAERGMRPVAQQRPPVGHRRGGDRVRGRVATDPEAVENDEDDRSGSMAVSGRLGPGIRPAHAAAPRAEAVRPARATIPAISSGLSEAPPTSAPSMDGSAKNSPMLAEVTLPP